MEESLVKIIRDNLERVLEKIAQAAGRARRKPADIRLVVVTKAQPVEKVRAAIDAGALILGENYVEEAVQKIESLQTRRQIQWHMIGHVQSRKARMVCEQFDLVHSLDSLKLAERYEMFSAEIGKTLPVLLEFNVGGEGSKSGWAAWEEDRWVELLPDLERVVSLPHLSVRGLMTMPPLFDAVEQARPFFRKLMRMQEFLAHHLPQADWAECSMGTSADYEIAIEEGATLVRVGQAILGPRPPRKLAPIRD